MSAEIAEQLADIVGATNVLTQAEDMSPYLREWRGHFQGRAAAVVCPGTTDEVSRVVALCAEHGLKIVPQGGNTGLVGGAVAESETEHVLLALRRMRRVRDVDVANDTITVEAGCVLAEVQRAADEAGRLFPLSLAAEGSCQIGGNLSTNAGGVNVLRYGNARDLVLGVEVVLADGRIWNGLTGLRKDNRGYDLKQLFVGSEGTLGIVTAAVLKLFPALSQRETALVALSEPPAAIDLLGRLRAASGDNMIACELISRLGLDLTVRHIDGARDPFDEPHPWYLLVELASPAAGDWLREGLETVLGEAFEAGQVSDAALADSLDQAHDFWHIREHIPEAQVREGASMKHDISVPVSRIPAFLERATAAVEQAMPGVRPCPFGHVGDGNLHFNLSVPAGGDAKAFLAEGPRLNRIVHDLVGELGGSFSAEHGVGRLKPADLAHYKSAVEVDLMRRVKTALDPDGVLNPGAVIPAEDA